MLCRALERAKELVIHVFDAFEEIMAAGTVEDDGGKSLFDGTRAATILNLIDLLLALSLATNELAEHRRPSEHREVREVDHIVETMSAISTYETKRAA